MTTVLPRAALQTGLVRRVDWVSLVLLAVALGALVEVRVVDATGQPLPTGTRAYTAPAPTTTRTIPVVQAAGPTTAPVAPLAA